MLSDISLACIGRCLRLWEFLKPSFSYQKCGVFSFGVQVAPVFNVDVEEWSFYVSIRCFDSMLNVDSSDSQGIPRWTQYFHASRILYKASWLYSFSLRCWLSLEHPLNAKPPLGSLFRTRQRNFWINLGVGAWSCCKWSRPSSSVNLLKRFHTRNHSKKLERFS